VGFDAGFLMCGGILDQFQEIILHYSLTCSDKTKMEFALFLTLAIDFVRL